MQPQNLYALWQLEFGTVLNRSIFRKLPPFCKSGCSLPEPFLRRLILKLLQLGLIEPCGSFGC